MGTKLASERVGMRTPLSLGWRRHGVAAGALVLDRRRMQLTPCFFHSADAVILLAPETLTVGLATGVHLILQELEQLLQTLACLRAIPAGTRFSSNALGGYRVCIAFVVPACRQLATVGEVLILVCANTIDDLLTGVGIWSRGCFGANALTARLSRLRTARYAPCIGVLLCALGARRSPIFAEALTASLSVHLVTGLVRWSRWDRPGLLGRWILRRGACLWPHRNRRRRRTVGFRTCEAKRINTVQWRICHKSVEIQAAQFSDRIVVDPSPQPRVVVSLTPVSQAVSSSQGLVLKR